MAARIVWAIIPTYNEAENVEGMARAVVERLRGCAAPGSRVLVVDDASPDGTGEIANRLAAEIDEVEVLHRPRKLGLGPAYLAGFERAIAAGAERIVEIDADFSHDPADIPRLLEASENADLVLGSRYRDGGGVEGWPLYRRIVSRGGCLYARAMLGVDIRDLTGGLKCFCRETLEAIDFQTIDSKGYAFQVEFTYRVLRRGLRVVEIPILFRERQAGHSKMSARIALEAAWRVPALRFAGSDG